MLRSRNYKTKNLRQSWLESLYRGLIPTFAVSWILTPVLFANIIGSDTQNFNPTVNPNDFVTVQSSRTLGHGNIGLGLFVDHAQNSLPFFTDGSSAAADSRKSVTDGLTSLHTLFGYGVNEQWDVFFTVPFVVAEKLDAKDKYHGHFRDTGYTEFRLGTKYRLLNTDLYGFAVVGSINFDKTRENPFSGKSQSPSFSSEVVGDISLGVVRLAANLGYRWRSAGEPVLGPDNDEPIRATGNQILASAAADYTFPDQKTHALAEVFAAENTYRFSEVSERSRTANEGLIGVKYFILDNLTVNSGFGGELRHSVSSADIRFYAGMHWLFATQAQQQTSDLVEPVTTAPTAPEAMQDWVDMNAAETSVEEMVPQEQRVILSDVLFGLNSAVVNESAAHKNLADVGRLLSSQRNLKRLVIEGYTCALGTERYNLKLSRKRAAAIKLWITKNFGVSANLIVIKGLGESKPIASNAQESGRRQNRRVEFKIFYHDDQKQAATAD